MVYADSTLCRCSQIESSESMETRMLYGRPYSMQMYTNRVITKCWKLVWCMADPTLCRCRKIESSASVGNSYGVWQTLLYADANKSSHQQGLETRMVYADTTLYRCRKIQSSASAGNSYGVCRLYSMQMQSNRVIRKCGNSYVVWQTLLYADVHKSSHHQVLETRMVYGRPYCMQMYTN